MESFACKKCGIIWTEESGAHKGFTCENCKKGCDKGHADIGVCKHRQMAAYIIDEFEGLLDKHKINIPSDDREGEPEEARIYGVQYYDLEDKITEMLAKKWR